MAPHRGAFAVGSQPSSEKGSEMQIDYDGLVEREPKLADDMAEAAQDDLSAPFALVMMALDKVRQSGSGQRISGEGFLRELRALAAQYRAGSDES